MNSNDNQNKLSDYFILGLFYSHISGKFIIPLKDLLWIKIFSLTSSTIPPSI